MKGVVEAQCGQSNALVGLAQTFGQSNQRTASSSSAKSLLPTSSLGEQMANEFLMKQSHTGGAPTSFSMKTLHQNLPQSSSSSNLAMKWSGDYQPRQNQLAANWSKQFIGGQKSVNFDSAWQSVQGPVSSGSTLHSQNTSVDSGMWSSEFLDNFDTTMTGGSSSSWADDYLGQEGQPMHDSWKGTHNEAFEETWQDIRNKVSELKEDDFLTASQDYRYEESNPYMTHENPLAEGDALMRSGDIGNAMLAYEAAVQKNPQDAEAWCRLGLSHAENEKDQLAMKAFGKCLEIDPSNREALLALSVSMANEGQENEALHQLDKWMSSYMSLDVQQTQHRPPLYSSFLDHEAFKAVEGRFLDAARQQGAAPDPDLQNALGVLYNLNRNFSRAVDSIKLAIASRPDDPRLWNRLGATLANGDRTAEAVSAYREALKRYPTYVRARYNLGISCMQLSTYSEALKHFVSALELQKGGSDGSSIWSTMRSAAIRVGDAPEALLRAVEKRDLNTVRSVLTTIPN